MEGQADGAEDGEGEADCAGGEGEAACEVEWEVRSHVRGGGGGAGGGEEDEPEGVEGSQVEGEEAVAEEGGEDGAG